MSREKKPQPGDYYLRWLADPKGVEQENRDRLRRLGPEKFLEDATGGRGVLVGVRVLPE